MNAAGIDVSKGKSMVAVARPFGEVAVKPFQVLHTSSEGLRKKPHPKDLYRTLPQVV